MVRTFCRLSFRVMPLVIALALGGCSYTTKSFLPEDIKSVHIVPVKNGIDLSKEVSDRDHFRVYRPGLEVDVTNAVINRFIFDGNLKVVSREKADSVLEATLMDYRRDPLRYSESDDIQEYRLSLVLAVEFRRNADGRVIWKENVVGDATFFLSGARATSEDEAAAKVVEDVSRRVVEKTIEIW